MWPATVHASSSYDKAFIKALDRMMVSLGPESARDSRRIKDAYRSHLDLLVLDGYSELEGALWNGGLAPLPDDTVRFNVRPRVMGPSPIGEKDLANQKSYIAARPATIGALLEVASRVKSGPLEVTSLVRHTEYQGALRSTNGNATTSVPMHTMGLAFDIALVNTPIETVYEIRDVLRRMRDAGDLLFIGERKQLVFHVVPHPSRLGHFTNVYARALGWMPSTAGTHVVALSRASAKAAKRAPAVTAEVVAIVPSAEIAQQWWAADHAHGDVEVVVSPGETPVAEARMATGVAPRGRRVLTRLLMLSAAFVAFIWPAVTHRPLNARPTRS